VQHDPSQIPSTPPTGTNVFVSILADNLHVYADDRGSRAN